MPELGVARVAGPPALVTRGKNAHYVKMSFKITGSGNIQKYSPIMNGTFEFSKVHFTVFTSLQVVRNLAVFK